MRRATITQRLGVDLGPKAEAGATSSGTPNLRLAFRVRSKRDTAAIYTARERRTHPQPPGYRAGTTRQEHVTSRSRRASTERQGETAVAVLVCRGGTAANETELSRAQCRRQATCTPPAPYACLSIDSALYPTDSRTSRQEQVDFTSAAGYSQEPESNMPFTAGGDFGHTHSYGLHIIACEHHPPESYHVSWAVHRQRNRRRGETTKAGGVPAATEARLREGAEPEEVAPPKTTHHVLHYGSTSRRGMVDESNS